MLNSTYKDPNFIEKFHRKFTSNQGDCDCVIWPDCAFPVAFLPDIIPKDFASSVKEELLRERFYEKHNDLYAFHQSDDLKNTKSKVLRELYAYFKDQQFLDWMTALTGIELTFGQMDLAGQRYKSGDRLLCHDDDIKSQEIGRRIAFIFYLVPPNWNRESGGNLNIFATRNAMPAEIVAQLTPQWNSLAFFEVTPESYHAVSEVLSQEERVSITGWFYGPVPEKFLTRPPKPHACHSVNFQSVVNTSDLGTSSLSNWINPLYLKSTIISQVSDAFMDQSYIEIASFLRDDKYAQLLAEFNEASSDSSQMKSMQPPTHHRYHQIHPLPSKIHELNEFLKSTEFTRYLHQITGLELKESHSEIRVFANGDYTLMSDETTERAPALDSYLSFSDAEWDDTHGGASMYVAGDDTLLEVSPGENKLTLVYRDEGVMRFVDYLTHKCTKKRQEFCVTYSE